MGFVLFLVLLFLLVLFFAALGHSAQEREESHGSGNALSPANAGTWRGPFDPRAPPTGEEATRESARCWIPPGQSATVAGRTIPGGMIYVGTGMRSLRGWGIDPALIVSDLDASTIQLDRDGISLSYWPSYERIPPGSRGAYLEWLSGGRRDPTYGIGYVFLFLYGLERRLLLDRLHLADATEESPFLLQEIRELLQVYGEHRSFASYATDFLDFVGFSDAPVDPWSLSPPPDTRRGYFPLSLQLGLGVRARERLPIPADWALAWLHSDSQSRLRTPAHRCRKEFDELFCIRYAEKYGDGMKVREPKSRLTIRYRPASASFSHAFESDTSDLPDMSRLTAPLSRLADLAEEVCTELDSYSRWIGKKKDPRSPEALSLIPRQLVRSRLGHQARRLRDFVASVASGTGPELVETAQLLSHFTGTKAATLTKAEAERLSDFLRGLGYGIEPDVRHGGSNPSRSDRIAVFPLSDGVPTPSESYHFATIILHLGAAIAGADGVIAPEEKNHLEEHLEQALDLSQSERARLRAHLAWLLANPPDLRGVRRRLEGVAEEVRRRVGQFLVTVAGADGHVSAEELDLMSRIYPVLGLEAASVYTDVHALATSTEGSAPGPVTILPADKPQGFPIPDLRPGCVEQPVTLDMRKVEAIREQTREAREVLGRVFAGEDDQGRGLSLEQQEMSGGTDDVTGLDAEHSALLRMAAEQRQWPREAFLRMAEECGVMPAGAIEIINEASFGLCDEPVFEGEDPIDVNQYAVEAMLS